MWTGMLDAMLRRLMRRGALVVTMPDGRARRYGEPSAAAPHVRITDEATIRRLALNPELALGEAYMDGTLVIEEDDLHGFLAAVIRNSSGPGQAGWLGLRRAAAGSVRRLRSLNNRLRAQRNVAHHYDLTPALYRMFLDEDQQYSCAYFRDPSATLEQAQADKKRHIARKLLIEPGMRVLDIGSGWGGLALTLARDFGARVTGITLSREQLAAAQARAAEAGLSDRVEFRLQDYREVSEVFDRVVSVGMFEHVGLPNYGTYFRAVRDRLTEDGVALIHTIGSPSPPMPTNPWIRKYIFPGGYIPSLSEIMPAVERAGLWLADCECWRLHYAMTLRHWHDRFMAHREEAERLHDARFVRMWRFYLAGSEQTFRFGRQLVFQLQLSRRVDAVPITRDYLCA
ncbi:cyclopropane-fatty-acyl-phospholipid synthase family protein [Rubellimicrobium sp. CFH 75288]|uniref:SAM-dependent methyltransferase n=1 Tax=Rubellimicrobium sp. CFH 75288 TaxID=2697034 RepID=UPI0014137803|nr:cyclopropane-fatty-acyl-phospholipid synthase family protein [Rubellimicrobium sp. CFH 75288]NAZ37622.1 methyltransferase domain-containing protein [Rubellimicrobium sp. CFH 75288]